MQNRLAASKLLLIPPALWMLLQVSLTLHHHHTYSYHNDQDRLHNVSTSLDKQVCTTDVIIGPQGRLPSYCPHAISSGYQFYSVPDAFAFTTPSRSRAPPAIPT